MIPIKLIYRAIFTQPIGTLNPAGFTFNGPVEVEIRKTGDDWAAFKPGSKDQFEPITPQISVDGLKSQMNLYFAKQISSWQTYQVEPARPPYIHCELLAPVQFYVDPQGRAHRRANQKGKES